MPELQCPQCHEQTRARFVWNFKNFYRRLANALLVPPPGFPDFPVQYRCRNCDCVFTPGQSRRADTHCPKCGYDLTGNVSGRCPECGRKIEERTAKIESTTETKAL